MSAHKVRVLGTVRYKGSKYPLSVEAGFIKNGMAGRFLTISRTQGSQTHEKGTENGGRKRKIAQFACQIGK